MGAYELNLEKIRVEKPKRDTTKIAFSDTDNTKLREVFPVMFNADVAKLFGVSQATIYRQARRLGLTKAPDFRVMMQGEMNRRASEALKGKLNSGQFQKGKRKNPAGEFKKGHKLTPEQEARRIANATATRNKTIAAERRRILFGLPQKTKLKLKV
jgi:DNA-binding MurR/RpiR family transcriptional regulator